jgi:phage terminase small subunit
MASAKKQDNQYKLFAQEYIKDLNATRAAIAAGYSEKTAYNSKVEDLLKTHVEVQQVYKRVYGKKRRKNRDYSR